MSIFSRKLRVCGRWAVCHEEHYSPFLMDKENRKKRIDIVFSTDPDFEYNIAQEEEEETLPPSRQQLRVSLDKKGRKGKAVTLVTNFIGRSDDLESLGKQLKSLCAAGGSVKEGEILIQGDFRQKIREYLEKGGYHVKQSGG